MVAGQENLLPRLCALLDRVPPERQYAVDIVERGYRNAALFGFIASHGLVPVLVQELLPGPSIGQVHETWRDLIVRGRAVVLKLHGENWSPGVRGRIHLGEPPQDDDRVIAEIVKGLIDAGLDVYINAAEPPRWSEPVTRGETKGPMGGHRQPT
jgi:hypothetical protein